MEVRFYHLTQQSLNEALPAILVKALAGERRVVVKLPDEKIVEAMNTHLWVYRENSFLPHGAKKDGYADAQPVWLTHKDENPNGADVLVLTGGSTSDQIDGFSLCCEMLNGHDDRAVSSARARWKSYKDAGHDVTYWQQTETGGWEKKA